MNTNVLIESVVRTFSLASLKSAIVADDDNVKGADGLELYIKNSKIKNAKLIEITNSLFITSHFYCYIFESAKDIDFNKLKKSQHSVPVDWNAYKTTEDNLSFDGFIEVDLSLQTYDVTTKKYIGDKRKKKCYVPFRIKKLDNKHIGILFSKFEVTEFSDNNNIAKVLENPHDPYMLALNAVQFWSEKKLIPHTSICDLTKGIKKLVSEKRINSLNVTVEIDGGAHETRKEGKKKNHYKFVPEAWHNSYLMVADRILRAKWYWYDRATVKDTRGLSSLSVEPSKGLVSQDTYVSDSQEELVNELLAANT